MSGKIQDAILKHLQANPHGATIPKLRAVVKRKTRDVVTALEAIPHKYIDHWDGDEPVYCLADVPPDLPHPGSGGSDVRQ